MSQPLHQAKIAISQGQWSEVTDHLREIFQGQNVGENNPELLSLSLQVLSQGDFPQKWEISQLIPLLGNQAISPLIQLVKDENLDSEERWFACRTLGKFNHPDALQTLVDLLKTTEEEKLSLEVAQILATFGADHLENLADLLTQEKSRLPATIALSHLSSPSIIEPLLTVINDPQPEIRQKALEGLGNFTDLRLISVFIQALKDPISTIRKEAISLLGNYANLLHKLPSELNLVSTVKPLLWDPNPRVCEQAIFTLSRFPTDESAIALWELLETSKISPIFPLKILQSLGRMQNLKGIDYLARFLQKLSGDLPENDSMIGEIMKIFATIENTDLKEKVTQILIDWIQQNSVYFLTSSKKPIYLKNQVIYTLGQLGNSLALPWLILLMSEDEPSIQFHCIAALKVHDHSQIFENLPQIYALIPSQFHSQLDQGILRTRQELGYYESSQF